MYAMHVEGFLSTLIKSTDQVFFPKLPKQQWHGLQLLQRRSAR